MFKLLPKPESIPGPLRVLQPTVRNSQNAVSCFRIEQSAVPDETDRVKRPRARLCFELLCRWDGKRRYHRMPGSGILIDAESPEQLRLLWEALTAWLQQLDGKYLAGPPPEPAAPISDGEPR